MSGAFNHDAVPGWQSYADDQGLTLHGRGKWRSVLCDFHADTDPSMRVNVESGGWVCMSCRAKGGDTLSHYMQRTGAGFVEAAQALGAWDATKAPGQAGKPRSLPAADAMELAAKEMLLLTVVIADIRRGVIPTDDDWHKFLQGAGRVEALAMEFRS